MIKKNMWKYILHLEATSHPDSQLRAVPLPRGPIFEDRCD